MGERMNMGANCYPFMTVSASATKTNPSADDGHPWRIGMKPPQLKARKFRPAQDKTNKEMAEIFKSLADENRLQILRILMREGKLHVSKICQELGESQPRHP